MPTHRKGTQGAKSISRPGHKSYATHLGSKFRVVSGHRVKPYRQLGSGFRSGISYMRGFA